MSPHDIDPNVDYQRLHQLSDEFTKVWNRLQAFYLDAVAGFAFVRSHVSGKITCAANTRLPRGKLDRDESVDPVVETALREHTSHDLWGDLRFIRTSIVHNQGIAT